jgi:2',3'-cyclic-nucleotide 2'-phosphodiesterase (5'-nucleotidase family)
MKQLFHFVIILSGAGLIACSSLLQPTETDQLLRVDASISNNTAIDSLIAPYSRLLAVEMNRIIGTSKSNLSVERPNSTLGAWACDVLVDYAVDSLGIPSNDCITLLNVGGLRASLSQGPITVGDVFKVMPFDNQIVAVKLDTTAMVEIVNYLRKSGGEPIAGFTIQNGKLITPEYFGNKGYFWVITTDFLANGGDNMLFFSKGIERKYRGTLIRNLFIISIEHEKLIGVKPLEERITW